MTDEQWRDELIEYALLVEAVARGDRSRVVKLFGDYILRKKLEAESQTEDEEWDGVNGDENRYMDQYDDEYADRYDEPREDYDDTEYNGEYYPAAEDDEDVQDRPDSQKRVRFADENNEYYQDEAGFDLNEEEEDPYYTSEEHEAYNQAYDSNDSSNPVDDEPYMSGALPTSDEGNTFSYLGDYDDQNELGQFPEEYDQYENNNSAQPGQHGESEITEGLDIDGEHEPYHDQMGDQDGGEWHGSPSENERVTNDEGQVNGFNDEEGDPELFLSEESSNSPGHSDWGELVSDLQQSPSLTNSCLGGYDGSKGVIAQDLEYDGGLQIPVKFNGTFQVDHLREEVQQNLTKDPVRPTQDVDSIDATELYSGSEEECGDELSIPTDSHQEELLYRDETEISNLPGTHSTPADYAVGHSSFLGNSLQLQNVGEVPETDLGRANGVVGFSPEFNHPSVEMPMWPNFEEDRFWDNPARPHFGAVMPWPGSPQGSTAEQGSLSALAPENELDGDLRCQSAEQVNPQYNVFERGQRFYDHYSTACVIPGPKSPRVKARSALDLRSLVDKVRKRIQ